MYWSQWSDEARINEQSSFNYWPWCSLESVPSSLFFTDNSHSFLYLFSFKRENEWKKMKLLKSRANSQPFSSSISSATSLLLLIPASHSDISRRRCHLWNSVGIFFIVVSRPTNPSHRKIRGHMPMKKAPASRWKHIQCIVHTLCIFINVNSIIYCEYVFYGCMRILN